MKNLFNNPWEEEKKTEKTVGSDSDSDHSLNVLLNFLGVARKKQNPNNNSENHDEGKPRKASEFSLFFKIFAGIVLLVWLSSGFYIVGQDQEGVVVRFGKYVRTDGPGLRWKFPDPIDVVTKVSVTRFNKVYMGIKGEQSSRFGGRIREEISNPKESQMLTADENIIDIHFFFQWRIKDSYDYLFNVRDIVDENTIKLAAESAMREVIGSTRLYDALSEKRQTVEKLAKDILQSTLDSYGAGVEVVSLGILYSYVAPEVRDAYRDVQSAKADKETAINKAQAYRNSIMPKARGESRTILEEAHSYKAARIADAQGEAMKFNAILAQYKKGKSIVKNKIYLEALEEVYGGCNKVIIEGKDGQGVLPILNAGNLYQKDGGVSFKPESKVGSEAENK